MTDLISKDGRPFQPWVLGLDISSHSTGWAFISVTEPVQLMKYGKIEMPFFEQFLDKLEHMIAEIEKLPVLHGLPAAVAIEEPICLNSGETTRLLAGLYACTSLNFKRAGLWPTPVNISTAKRSFVGKGGGGKQPTVDTCNRLFGTTFTVKEHNDICDAIQAACVVRTELVSVEGSWFWSHVRGNLTDALPF